MNMYVRSAYLHFNLCAISIAYLIHAIIMLRRILTHFIIKNTTAIHRAKNSKFYLSAHLHKPAQNTWWTATNQFFETGFSHVWEDWKKYPDLDWLGKVGRNKNLIPGTKTSKSRECILPRLEKSGQSREFFFWDCRNPVEIAGRKYKNNLCISNNT